MPETITDEIADRILDDLEQLKLTPTETARQARRLGLYIDELRREIASMTADAEGHLNAEE